jgi:hypothetical protein
MRRGRSLAQRARSSARVESWRHLVHCDLMSYDSWRLPLCSHRHSCPLDLRSSDMPLMSRLLYLASLMHTWNWVISW